MMCGCFARIHTVAHVMTTPAVKAILSLSLMRTGLRSSASNACRKLFSSEPSKILRALLRALIRSACGESSARGPLPSECRREVGVFNDEAV